MSVTIYASFGLLIIIIIIIIFVKITNLIMKNLFYLFLVVTMFDCSSDDSDSSNSNGNSINPPAWIQGVWINDTSSVFEFRTDDMCLTAGTTTCYKALMALSSESSAYEEISDTRYYVVISFAGVSESTYEFEKVSESTINWILYPSGIISTFTKN